MNRVIEWLPTDAIDLDLRCFRNAAISVADRTNPTRPVREFTRLKATDGHVRALIYAVDPFQLTERRRTTATTCQRFDGVFSAGFVDTLRDSPEVARELREVIENDRFNFYQCEDEPPVHLVVTEDAVGLLLASATGTFPALLESHNETVISWANEKYERYRERATPITAEDIPIAHRRAD